MDPMLHRHCAKFIYIVPSGLRELMSDISREVIRSQPKEIYTFIADYLDAMMISRENARIAQRLIQSITEIAELTVDLLKNVGMTRAEADKIAAEIQKVFKSTLEEKKTIFDYEIVGEYDESTYITERILHEFDMSYEQMEEVTKIIQHAFRKFQERRNKEKDLLFGMVDWRVAARSAIALYNKCGVSVYEANKAASLIKAAYKGYYTRRVAKRLLQIYSEDNVSIDEEEEEEATVSSYGKEQTYETEEAEEETQPTEAIYGTGDRTVVTDEIQISLDVEEELDEIVLEEESEMEPETERVFLSEFEEEGEEEMSGQGNILQESSEDKPHEKIQWAAELPPAIKEEPETVETKPIEREQTSPPPEKEPSNIKKSKSIIKTTPLNAEAVFEPPVEVAITEPPIETAKSEPQVEVKFAETSDEVRKTSEEEAPTSGDEMEEG